MFACVFAYIGEFILAIYISKQHKYIYIRLCLHEIKLIHIHAHHTHTRTHTRADWKVYRLSKIPSWNATNWGGIFKLVNIVSVGVAVLGSTCKNIQLQILHVMIIASYKLFNQSSYIYIYIYIYIVHPYCYMDALLGR